MERGNMGNRKNVIQEKSYELALTIIRIVEKLPRNTQGFVLGKQLLRSGTSVGANVEEAIGAFSKDDFTYKMSIALKEARETHYWLRLLKDSKLLTETVMNPILSETAEVMRILGAIVKKSRAE